MRLLIREAEVRIQGDNMYKISTIAQELKKLLLLPDKRYDSTAAFATFTQNGDNLPSIWKKAQIIAEVYNLDNWTALWQGQGAEGVLFHLSKSFEKIKGEKERRKPLNITFCLWCQLLTASGKHEAGSLA